MPLSERELELLRLLEGYLARLREQSTIDPASVEPFGPTDAAVQRWLQLDIQCCLDLGDGALGRLGEPEPPRYGDIFPALARRSVIDEALARHMERITGHRNALARAYSDLTPAETWRWLREGLPTLTQFAERVSRT